MDNDKNVESAKTAKALYALHLGETLNISYSRSMTRVPGGWVYQCDTSVQGHMIDTVSVSSTFVPFHSEFLETK